MITETGHSALFKLGLTRQARTIDLIIQGKQQVAVADELQISRETVKQHLQRARKVLQMPNTAALVAYVVQKDWMKVDAIGEHRGPFADE